MQTDNQQCGKPGRPAKYPWREMAVGDSFLALGRTAKSLRGCAFYHKPKKFRTKEIIIKGVHGTRVWRIE